VDFGTVWVCSENKYIVYHCIVHRIRITLCQMEPFGEEDYKKSLGYHVAKLFPFHTSINNLSLRLFLSSASDVVTGLTTCGKSVDILVGAGTSLSTIKMFSAGFHLGPQQQRRNFWAAVMGPEIQQIPKVTVTETSQNPKIMAPEIQQCLEVTAPKIQQSTAANSPQGLKRKRDASGDEDDAKETKRLKKNALQNLRREKQRLPKAEDAKIPRKQNVRYTEDEKAFLETWHQSYGSRPLQVRDLAEAFNDKFNDREPRQPLAVRFTYHRLAAKKAAIVGDGVAKGTSGISQWPMNAEEKKTLATIKETNADVQQNIPPTRWRPEHCAKPNTQEAKTAKERAVEQTSMQTKFPVTATREEFSRRYRFLPPGYESM